jgi:transcriptional regulator with GAF, ATPase, and Fis domain
MVRAWTQIEHAARSGDVLLLGGESGAGKEVAARAFHASGPSASGPFVAVNCATLPHGLAESLLFGARKGAFSGAIADTDGYFQSADGGTLFLDEVAELDPQVQAKLLRALEVREVVPLGASRPRRIDVRICAATHDLRAQVGKGRFREDLYFRLGRPEVRVPPLRERREEIPWLIAAELARAEQGLTAQASLVEACMVRHWPGNVRELLSEVRRIVATAQATGRASLTVDDLDTQAGTAFAPSPGEQTAGSAGPPDQATIERALRARNNNVTQAARDLGMHRNQLRRWLAKHGGLDAVGAHDPESDESDTES